MAHFECQDVMHIHGGWHSGTPRAPRTRSTHSHRKENRQPHWHWGTALTTPPTTATTPGRTGWPFKRRCTGQWMPQPRTPRCPRRCLHSRATLRPMCEGTGQHRRSAGCPRPQTRSGLPHSAPPACKNTQISCGVCTGRRRDRDRRTAYSPRRTETGPLTGARTAPSQTEAPPRGGERLGPPGQAAQTGAQSGPGAAATRSKTEAEGPGVPTFRAGRTCRHEPRIARRRRSTGSVRSHA